MAHYTVTDVNIATGEREVIGEVDSTLELIAERLESWGMTTETTGEALSIYAGGNLIAEYTETKEN